MFFSELYQFSRELKKLILLFVTLPVKPTDVVVLTIGVVIAVLCSTPLISAAEHRHALGKKECREKIAALPVAQRVNLGHWSRLRRRNSTTDYCYRRRGFRRHSA